MNFSGGNPTPVTRTINGIGGTSAISDTNGNLLFYSNGARIYQANGVIMMNGDNLVGDNEATQSSIIIPSPVNNTRYYVVVNDANAGPNGLQYYDVEMTLNGGNGAVLGPTQLMTVSTEKLCATRHGNDRDYWVVAHSWNNNQFHAFLIDENGMNSTPVISSTGFPHLNSAGASEKWGQMKISPDGRYIATCLPNSGYVQLFRFNNITGVVSDPITLISGSIIFPFGVEFSADSKKIFFTQRYSSASNPATIHQYDLDHVSVDCLIASEQIVGNNNPFKLYTDLQLGTNKKIYVAYEKPGPLADTLGLIATPELMCPDCDYTDNSLLLNNGMRRGLTNFVSSFLSDGITYTFGSNCENDTTWFFPEDTLGLDSVRWNFGDPASGAVNNTSTLFNAPHVFTHAPDTFTVSLHAYRAGVAQIFERNVIIWDTAVNLLGNDTTLCDGDPVTLDATWYNACVIWDDSSTNLEYTTSQAGWHWVDVFHQSCQWRDSVYVTVVNDVPQFNLGNDTMVCADVNFVIDPALTNAYYTWQDGSHDTTFTVGATGTYWLLASNACGTASDTLNVILNTAAQPVLNFPDDTTVCDSAGIVLDVSFDQAVYLWNDGLTTAIREIFTPGAYWVRVGNSCDTVQDTIVINMDSPVVGILPEREVYCGPGDTLGLLATADSLDVLWSDGSNAPFIQIISQGTYSFTQNNVCGYASDTIRVTRWDEDYTLFIGNDTTLCHPLDSIQIGEMRDDYPWKFVWNTGQKISMITAGSGSYELKASHRCATLRDNVIIGTAPSIFISDTLHTTWCDGDQFNISLSSPYLNQILWNTGDSTSEIQIKASGQYNVIMTDTFGCVHTDSIYYDDLCPGIVFVPNVFTPNSDLINDEYCLELENIADLSFTVMDRWGRTLFQTTDQDLCWDGTFGEQACSPGTYYYIVNTTDAMGEKAFYRGSFTLIR